MAQVNIWHSGSRHQHARLGSAITSSSSTTCIAQSLLCINALQEALLLEQSRLQKLQEIEKRLHSGAADAGQQTQAIKSAPSPALQSSADEGAAQEADPLEAFMTDLSTQMDMDKVGLLSCIVVSRP